MDVHCSEQSSDMFVLEPYGTVPPSQSEALRFTDSVSCKSSRSLTHPNPHQPWYLHIDGDLAELIRCCDSDYCIAEHFRQEFNFVAFVKAIFLTKLNSWLNFSQNYECGIRNIYECEDKRQATERRPTFDENKFLTNCQTVAFDEIFRWRKFLSIQ